jgi:F-type H+-transporting ATPase subunit b
LSLLAFAGSIQLVPDGTLLLHLALVVLMVALLNVTLLRPINRILEERERRTRGRIGEADSIRLGVQEKLREYENRMREARARGYLLLEAERTGASKEREQSVAEVRAEVTGWLNEEKTTLQIAEEQAKAKLGKDARSLALEISGQILGRPVREISQS